MISHISKDIYINTLFYQAHSAKFFLFYIITILVLIGFCVGIRYTKPRDRAYLKRITFSTFINNSFISYFCIHHIRRKVYL